MSLADDLRTICSEYLPTRSLTPQKLAQLRRLVEVDAVNHLRAIINPANYTIRGHTLQGRVADAPWIGIHDRRIDSSPTTGVYVALIFKVDGSGAVLSLQHGTENKGLGSIKQETARLSRAVALPNTGFTRQPVSLRPASGFARTSRPGKYEVASIIGKEYGPAELTDDISSDVQDLIRVYGDWAAAVLMQDLEPAYQSESPDPIIAVPDEPPERMPRRIVRPGSLHPPRDANQGAIALRNADHRCEVDPTHSTFRTALGHQFMEKHHLIPMERYFDFRLAIDHPINIFSLCPLCHRRIHYADGTERARLIKHLFNKRHASLRRIYGVGLADLLAYYQKTNSLE
jgi:5-methylcytosine-specific restriction protein A